MNKKIKYKIRSYLDLLTQRIHFTQLFIEKYWLKALMISMCVYILVQKDISFQVSMNSANTIHGNNTNALVSNKAAAALDNESLSKQLEELNIGGALSQIVRSF